MGAIERGFRNPFRNKVRAGVVVFLLALIIGLFAVMVQAAFHTQKQLEGLQASVRTFIEMREGRRTFLPVERNKILFSLIRRKSYPTISSLYAI